MSGEKYKYIALLSIYQKKCTLTQLLSDKKRCFNFIIIDSIFYKYQDKWKPEKTVQTFTACLDFGITKENISKLSRRFCGLLLYNFAFSETENEINNNRNCYGDRKLNTIFL